MNYATFLVAWGLYFAVVLVDLVAHYAVVPIFFIISELYFSTEYAGINIFTLVALCLILKFHEKIISPTANAVNVKGPDYYRELIGLRLDRFFSGSPSLAEIIKAIREIDDAIRKTDDPDDPDKFIYICYIFIFFSLKVLLQSGM
ncbi:MAG: hypothetical protein LBJ36_04660 [Synergistaceae bacterium]|nr:hypothetical protein [Synergistaceae bacterium]